jgi:hypothetical protein
LDAEVQLAIAQGNADLQAELESRRLDLDQQIAINAQTLEAMTVAGQQTIDIAGLLETREITQAQIDLTAKMETINNRIEVALENGNNVLAADLQAERLIVEQTLTTNNQRLNAMVAEGQQTIEIAQMAETRKIEESRQKLTASLANMDAELKVAIANGDNSLAASIESRKLAVTQQMSVNDQILRALTAEGVQAVDIAALVEQRNINQARIDVDVELANLQAEKEMAIAEGDNALQARIKSRELKLQKKRDDATLRLQALTEEGRQELENRSLKLTANIENARLNTTVSIENLRSDLSVALQNNDSASQALIQSSINRLNAKGQDLQALISTGDQLLERAALVQSGELTEMDLIYERQNHLDSIDAQIAIAENEGEVDLARQLIAMRDNQLARNLQAAIVSEELTLQERTDIRAMIVNKDLAEARLKLDAILGDKRAAAEGLGTVSDAVNRSSAILAQLSDSEKTRLLEQSEFLDTIDFDATTLENQLAIDIARLESGEDIASAETLMSSLNAMGALNLSGLQSAIDAETGSQERQVDFLLQSAGQALDFVDKMKRIELGEMTFAESATARRNGEIVQVSSFLTGSFFDQAALDNAQASGAINATAVEKQAIQGLRQLALMQMEADIAADKAKRDNDDAGWKRWSDRSAAIFSFGVGIGGPNWLYRITGVEALNIE